MRQNPESHSSEYWHDRAREVRTVADRLATGTNRRQMLAVAENYERLADEAEAEEQAFNVHRSPR